MSPRHLALIAGAVVTLGGLVYIFVEVQSSPASGASDDRPNVAGRTSSGETPTRGTTDPAEAARTKLVGDRRAEPAQATDAIASQMKGTITAEPEPVPPPADDPPSGDVEIEHGSAMDEANKHYDRGDYEAALKQALRVLEKDAGNVRMTRVVVSSACMMGDADTATKHNVNLPPNDQRDMARRCQRYGIALQRTEPAEGGASPRLPKKLNPLVKNE
jgi:hypothetical protein